MANSSPSYTALKQQRDEIDNRLRELRDGAIKDFKARVLAEAEALEVDILELFGTAKKPKRRGAATAPIKYRDPKNPQNTWSGRGRPAKWLKAKMDAGEDKEDYAV